MNKNLLILGAGQYGTVVKEIAKSMDCFHKIDFLDDSFGIDNPNYHENSIGRIDKLAEYRVEYTYGIAAIGDAHKRLELLALLEENGFRIPVIVSPHAYVSPSAQLQKGVVIEPLAGIHANVAIASGSYISMGAVINHNSMVCEGCHVDNNAVIMSGVLLAAKTKIEPCAVVRRQARNFSLDMDGYIIESHASMPHN